MAEALLRMLTLATGREPDPFGAPGSYRIRIMHWFVEKVDDAIELSRCSPYFSSSLLTEYH